MSGVQIYDNLKVKEIDGQIMFDAETAAIGLGLTKMSKGNQYVRWERVNEYLGLSTSGQLLQRNDFITEPQFYKLAIKANNATAEKFQDWVTSEVLPSIRKTGSYKAQVHVSMNDWYLIEDEVANKREREAKNARNLAMKINADTRNAKLSFDIAQQVSDPVLRQRLVNKAGYKLLEN